MMKKIYTLLIALFLAGGVMGQNDYWFQKGVKVKKPVKKIEYFTKSIEMERAAAESLIFRVVYCNLGRSIEQSFSSE